MESEGVVSKTLNDFEDDVSGMEFPNYKELLKKDH
jgi:hypothetical protein